MAIGLKQLREPMGPPKQFDVTEVEIEKDGERIYLRRGGDVVTTTALVPGLAPSPAHPASLMPPPVPSVGGAILPPATVEAANITPITPPFVGTFYRSPSPDAASFVEVGTDIRPGTVLCIVEAMKLMNEIESEIAGTIVEVVGENGKPVEYGDVLFRVRKP